MRTGIVVRLAAPGVAAATLLVVVACGDHARELSSPSAATASYTLSGTVGEAPLNGGAVADLRIEVMDGPNAGRAATTDVNGRYTLSDLAPSVFQLRASKSGYVRIERSVTLDSNTTLDLTVVRGCAVTGVVRESPGGAVSAGATVKIVNEPGGYSAPAIVTASTDAIGSYRLDGLQCGFTQRLRVEKNDFFPQELPVMIAGEPRQDVTIERLTYSLFGTVRESPSGAPVRDATVHVLTGPYAGRTATTHTDGSYGLSVRDTVTLRASKLGYTPQEVVVTITSSPSYRDFTLPIQSSTR